MNWLKKYQQGGATYNPGNETTIHGVNMYNPWQVTNPNMSLANAAQPDPWATNNPNSQETMDDVYAGRDIQDEQSPQDQTYLKTTTKRTFGTPNWQYIATANMVGDGLSFLANQGKNSSQNAIKRYNDRKLDPLNTLMANPNTSAQDQAGSGYYKMGGWISKYQDGGEFDDDEDYLFGLDDIPEEQEVVEEAFSKRKNLQQQYNLEQQQDLIRQMQQEAFFSSLVNSDGTNVSVDYTPSNSNTSSSSGVLAGIFRNEGARTGQPTNLNSSAVGRGQMIKGTRNAMYRKLGFTNLAEAEQKYRTDPDFETRVMNAYKDELSERIPSSITGKERDYRIAKGWYTGDPNYPDNKVPHPEAGNRLTAGEYARRAVGFYQEGGEVDFFKKGGIHIKPENKGKFTDYCGGEVTSECIKRGKNSPNPTTRKRATFAANARKWKHQDGGIIDPMGQWNHPGEVTTIPSNEITMQGVPYPVLGISDVGHIQMMQPNQDYFFEGNSVTEYPLMNMGGSWISKYC